MKIFSGPEKTVTDERVVKECYKAGHFSFVIIIFLILLDYIIRGAILGNSEEVKTHLLLIAIPSFYFMVTLAKKGVWMSELSINRKKTFLITAAVATLIINIIDRFSTGYLSKVQIVNEWISVLLMLVVVPVIIGVSIIFVFMKISEKKEEKLVENGTE